MEQRVFGGGKASEAEPRSVYESTRRGFFGHCPCCGRGRLFRAFLKTVECCQECGEEMHHHRADDLPAYLVIVIVGHIVVSAFMTVQAVTDWPTWAHLVISAPATLVLSLAPIGPVKGAVVGLQWALRMHGFGGEKDRLASHPELRDHRGSRAAGARGNGYARREEAQRRIPCPCQATRLCHAHPDRLARRRAFRPDGKAAYAARLHAWTLRLSRRTHRSLRQPHYCCKRPPSGGGGEDRRQRQRWTCPRGAGQGHRPFRAAGNLRGSRPSCRPQG